MQHQKSTGHTRYLLVVLAAFVAAAVAVASTSYWLNPFGIFAHGSIAGSGHIDLFWHARLHKAYRINHVAPQQLILGSSRAGRLSPVLLEGDSMAYNAALPGATLYEIKRQLEHANTLRPVEKAVIGLDFYMLLASRPATMAGFSNQRLRRQTPSAWQRLRHWQQQLADYTAALLSRSALTANIKQLFGRPQPNSRQFMPNGSWQVQPGKLAGHWVYSMQVRELFMQINQAAPALNPEPLRQLLHYAAQQNIQLVFLLSPDHAYQLNAIDLSGGWADYLSFIAAVTVEIEAATATGTNASLYAFGLSEELVFEPIGQQYHWYLDGTHYTRAAGDVIVSCLLQAQRNCNAPVTRSQLTAQTVSQYQQHLSELKKTYAHTHSGNMRRLRKQIEKLRQQGSAR